MGLGAISLTGEKASDLKKELLTKGEAMYQEGMVKNEELKRNIQEKVKNSITVEIKKTDKIDVVSAIKEMSPEEKQEILELLRENKKTGGKETKINDSDEENVVKKENNKKD